MGRELASGGSSPYICLDGETASLEGFPVRRWRLDDGGIRGPVIGVRGRKRVDVRRRGGGGRMGMLKTRGPVGTSHVYGVGDVARRRRLGHSIRQLRWARVADGDGRFLAVAGRAGASR